MKLTDAQRKFLRRRGHALKPVVTIGAARVTDAVLAELNNALEHHELIKIRIRAEDRAERNALLDRLLRESGAALVQRVGHIALVYRPAEAPMFVLPVRA